ncbi:MAG: hypothetical protein AB4063_17325 [Crocosphaera sp.]
MLFIDLKTALGRNRVDLLVSLKNNNRGNKPGFLFGCVSSVKKRAIAFHFASQTNKLNIDHLKA